MDFPIFILVLGLCVMGARTYLTERLYEQSESYGNKPPESRWAEYWHVIEIKSIFTLIWWDFNRKNIKLVLLHNVLSLASIGLLVYFFVMER